MNISSYHNRQTGHRLDKRSVASLGSFSPTRLFMRRLASFQPESILSFTLSQAKLPEPGLISGAACNSIVFALGYSVLRKGLTNEGVAHSWLLGCLSYSAFGWKAYLLLCLYFILGTLATKVKMKQKEKEGIAEARQGQRGPASVWGSGIAAAACASLALSSSSSLLPGAVDNGLMRAGFIASICSKLSDTVSSEIGKAYGTTTYLITTMKLVPRGTEGAVSAEGTMAGMGAAFIFSLLALLLNQVTLKGAAIVALAAVIANTFESFLGASIQGRSGFKWLTNDLVNMIQISLAAALAIMGCHLLL
jgi:uncharacterized protein (TIGR00297 family)